MKYYYFSPDEKARRKANGLAAAFVLVGDKMREFTITNDLPLHSSTHRLVFVIDLH
jgi:hypothetical protein